MRQWGWCRLSALLHAHFCKRSVGGLLLAVVASVAVHSHQRIGCTLAVVEVFLVDIGGHPHHGAGYFLVFIGIARKVHPAIGARRMTEVATHAQRRIVGTHQPVQLFAINILGQYFKILGSGMLALALWLCRYHSDKDAERHGSQYESLLGDVDVHAIRE